MSECGWSLAGVFGFCRHSEIKKNRWGGYCFRDGSSVILYQVSKSVLDISCRADSGFLTSFRAFVGHVETQSPHPMQRSMLRFILSSELVIASIWHLSIHTPHPIQASMLYSTLNELLIASAGLGCRFKLPRIPQQQPQQQHIAETLLELVGFSTRFALFASVILSFICCLVTYFASPVFT